LALFFPRDYILFPSDSIGTLTEERILPMGSSNYDYFQQSIDKLCKIKAEIICFEHFGALTPPEGMEFCGKAKQEAENFRKEMVDIYKKNKDLELTVKKMAGGCYTGLSRVGLLPEDLLKNLLKRMVTFVNQIE